MTKVNNVVLNGGQGGGYSSLMRSPVEESNSETYRVQGKAQTKLAQEVKAYEPERRKEGAFRNGKVAEMQGVGVM